MSLSTSGGHPCALSLHGKYRKINERIYQTCFIYIALRSFLSPAVMTTVF